MYSTVMVVVVVCSSHAEAEPLLRVHEVQEAAVVEREKRRHVPEPHARMRLAPTRGCGCGCCHCCCGGSRLREHRRVNARP